MGRGASMIDLSNTLDAGTNLPSTWKTLVRELLLKFEDGCTYHHDNIAGNRPYHVDLKITIDDSCNDDEYTELHEEAKKLEEGYNAMNELLDTIYGIVSKTSSKEEGLDKLREINTQLKNDY